VHNKDDDDAVLWFRKLVTVCVEECRLETLLKASNVGDVGDENQSSRHAVSSHKSAVASWLVLFKVNCSLFTR